MITIKRQIESENERYGAFAETESYVDTTSEREVNDDLLLMRSFTSNAVEVSEPVESASIPVVREKTETIVRPDPVVEERRVEVPSRRSNDVKMHDIIRREEPVEEVRWEEKPITREKKLTASAKKAIAVYLSIVLALVIGIIITGVCISGVSSEISTLENTIQEQEETIFQQNAELAALEDANAIAKKAEDYGMVKITDGEIVGFEGLEIGADTEDKSGVFDSVRDWLNTVFGG